LIKIVLLVDKTKFLFALTSFLLLMMFSAVSQACIGEVAGRVHFDVNAGGTETLHMQVFNSCSNVSVDFSSFAQLQPLINQTTPVIQIFPKNGTLAPSQNKMINITIYMPSNAIFNTTWSGGAAVIENGNSTGSGANLQSGVAKILTVTALPPVANPIPIVLLAGAALIIVAAGAAIYYFMKISNKEKAKKSAFATTAKKRLSPSGRKGSNSRKQARRK
jgi:hypothetical protein